MIGHLRGRLAAKHPPALVVDVGGVGYELEAPMSTFYNLPPVGAEVLLHTHLVVRDDAHLLYGFASEQERRLFRDLLKVSGVGPKIALALLSGVTADAFALCIESGDIDTLTRIPGIGRKTAERLVIEMRDRVRALTAGAVPTLAGQTVTGAGAQAEAFAALVALGYKPAEVSRLIKSVEAEGATTEDIIRSALRAASR
ncbi:MAG: Holliday junction branch migration protein RuvA [Steroidobacteraceae bacterium]|nr:Holliday junction branch migration protein RuvA [Steroidobacteraceae bacterium]